MSLGEEGLPRYLTSAEVCRRLRVSPKTLQLWRRAGRLDFYQFGHRSVRFLVADVERLEKESHARK